MKIRSSFAHPSLITIALLVRLGPCLCERLWEGFDDVFSCSHTWRRPWSFKSPRWSCPLNSFKSAGETNLNQNEKKRYRCCITQISSKCLVPLNWETTLSPMTLWSGQRIVRQCCQVWLLRNTWHQKNDIKNNSDGVGIRVTWEHLLDPIGLALRWRSTFETSTNDTRTAQKRKTEWHEKNKCVDMPTLWTCQGTTITYRQSSTCARS